MSAAIPCADGTGLVAYPFFIVYYMITSLVLINVVVGFLLEKMVCVRVCARTFMYACMSKRMSGYKVVDKSGELPAIIAAEHDRIAERERRRKLKKKVMAHIGHQYGSGNNKKRVGHACACPIA